MKITEEFITSPIDEKARADFENETWRKTRSAYNHSAPHWLLRLVVRYLIYFFAVVFFAFIFFFRLTEI